jgi:hypothetical protein
MGMFIRSGSCGTLRTEQSNIDDRGHFRLAKDPERLSTNIFENKNTLRRIIIIISHGTTLRNRTTVDNRT